MSSQMEKSSMFFAAAAAFGLEAKLNFHMLWYCGKVENKQLFGVSTSQTSN